MQSGILERHLPDVIREYYTPECALVPQFSGMPRALKQIHAALSRFRGHQQFASERRALRCDFGIPSARLIIEYDERQHFSTARAISLQHYPQSLQVGFNVQEWLRHCTKIDAKDNSPPFRDEQRAFYDTVRDFAWTERGFKVVQLKMGKSTGRAAQVKRRS